MVQDSWRTCFDNNEVLCFANMSAFIEYANKLPNGHTIFYYLDVSKEITHKTVRHRFASLRNAGMVLGETTTIFFIEDTD